MNPHQGQTGVERTTILGRILAGGQESPITKGLRHRDKDLNWVCKPLSLCPVDKVTYSPL